MSEVQTIEHEPRGDAALIPSAQTPMAILRHAILNGASLEVIDRLMALQERYERNLARKEFDQAIAAFKAKLPVIEKNKHVGFKSKKAGATDTSYWHEDLGQIARTIDPILGENGLSYRFRVQSEVDKPVIVTCIISHKLGHFEETTLSGPKDQSGNKNALQSIGSAITYLQRYTLKAALGLAAARDDDAQSAEEEETIDEEQMIELREGLEAIAQTGGSDGKPFDTKATIKRFCDALQIELLGDLPVSRLQEAKDLLAQGRGKK